MVQSQFKRGSYYVFCSICADRIFNTDAVVNWKGRWVCKKDYEANPNDTLILPFIQTEQQVPFAQPNPAPASSVSNNNSAFTDATNLYPSSIT